VSIKTKTTKSDLNLRLRLIWYEKFKKVYIDSDSHQLRRKRHLIGLAGNSL